MTNQNEPQETPKSPHRCCYCWSEILNQVYVGANDGVPPEKWAHEFCSRMHDVAKRANLVAEKAVCELNQKTAEVKALKSLTTYQCDIDHHDATIIELFKKENAQLKQEVEELKSQVEGWRREVFLFRGHNSSNLDDARETEEILRSENAQLKQEIERLRATTLPQWSITSPTEQLIKITVSSPYESVTLPANKSSCRIETEKDLLILPQGVRLKPGECAVWNGVTEVLTVLPKPE